MSEYEPRGVGDVKGKESAHKISTIQYRYFTVTH